MAKFLILIFGCFVLALPASAEQKGVAKIGVILPLTGPLAEFGVALRNGIALAQQKESEMLGKLHVVYEDSQYNPQTAITIFRKFASDSDVKFIINFGCPTSQAIAPLAEQSQIPTAMFCSSRLLTKGKKFAFGMTSPANEWALILSQYLEARGFRNLCFVLTQNDYLVSEYEALLEQAFKRSKAQLTTLVDQYTPQELDFRTSVLKLRSKSCDALGVYLLPGQIRAFFEQARPLQLKSQIFGTDVFESIEEITASKGAMEGAVFVNLAVPAQFRDRYIAKYRNENQLPVGCVAHDLMIRVGKILAAHDGTMAGNVLMRRIQESGVLSGECGASSFVLSGNGEQFVRFPVVLKSIVHGKVE